MKPVAAEIVSRFEEAGWRVEVAGDLGNLDAVAVKPYAIAGISVLSSPSELADTWFQTQSDLARFRTSSATDPTADAYLLLVVGEIPDGMASRVSSIASDTTVCRKLIVELRGRRSQEALDDTPLLPLSELDARGRQRSPVATRVPSDLPEEVLQRLAKDGAERILDTLIEMVAPEGQSDET